MKAQSELWRDLGKVLEQLGQKISDAKSDLVLIDVPGKTVGHAEEILNLSRRLAGLCGVPVEPNERCADLAGRLDQTVKALADCRDSLGKSVSPPGMAAFLRLCCNIADDHFYSKGFFLARSRFVLLTEGKVHLKGYLGTHVYHHASQKNPSINYAFQNYQMLRDGDRCLIEDNPVNRERIILGLHEKFPAGNILSWESSAFDCNGQATGAFVLLGAKISLDLADFVSLTESTQHEGERKNGLLQGPAERAVQAGPAPASV